jgi:hypothetical protein
MQVAAPGRGDSAVEDLTDLLVGEAELLTGLEQQLPAQQFVAGLKKGFFFPTTELPEGFVIHSAPYDSGQRQQFLAAIVQSCQPSQDDLADAASQGPR